MYDIILMIYQIIEALWNCCFRYKDEHDKKHDELKIILNNIKHSIKQQSNICC
jgi:hypothetical protein